MMRMERLCAQFRDYSFIANNRNPYANCASILYRGYKAEKLSINERKEILSLLSAKWLMRSLKIKDLMSTFNAPLLTYEEFCRNPSSIMDILNLPDGVSESINPNADVIVKDYGAQPISDQNQRQVSKLNDEEIDHISESLKSNNQLLDFFGYQLMR